MIVIGVTGLARSGKDIYCKIAQSILSANGFHPQKYAFADALKTDVEPFLRDVCKCDVWTDNTEIKTDIRDFLVWYGTTWWRKREPTRWIRLVEEKMKSESWVNASLISDVRYPNEGHWVHSKDGWLVHISKYVKLSPDAGKTWKRKYQVPPNEQEAKNDPIMQEMSDYKVQWEDLTTQEVKINPQELVSNMYLREEVFKSLQACPSLSQKLKRM